MFAEFALIAVERAAIDTLSEGGDRRATATAAALRSLSFQLSGAQLGITITSLIVGFLAEPAIGRLLEPLLEDLDFIPAGSTLAISIALALVLATAVEMVVAELFPKNFAIARPLETALATATPLRLFNALLQPLIVFLNAAANMTVRAFGIEPREELAGIRTLDELDLVIQASREQGALADEEASLLARSISFSEKTAADALVPRTTVRAVAESDTLARLAQVALESGHSRLPVYGRDLDDIVGIAHVKDLYRYPPEERGEVTVAEIARDALVVPESRALGSLLVEMRRETQQIAVVLDEYGGTAGIITLEDVLEEIVGEIEDEYDPRSVAQPASPTTGVHVLAGMLHREEVEEACGFEMPEGDYETLAGFLLTLLDRIPQAGDHASYGGWEFKVVEMDRRRIAKVLAVAPPPVEEEEA